jgi:hypothetical protein
MKLGLCCGAMIVALAVSCGVPLRVQTETQLVAEEHLADPLANTWRDVRGENAKLSAVAVATLAGAKFRHGGMSAEFANMLQADVQVVFESMFAPDFDVYRSLMESKGCRLDRLAAGFIKAMAEWRVYEEYPKEFESQWSAMEKVRFLWNHPGPRNVDWKEVRLDSVECGVGLTVTTGSAEWPYHGGYGQASLFAPSSGRLSNRRGTELDESGDWKAVWVSVEGRFASGMQTRLRINFYLDESINQWIPVTLIFGEDGEHKPFGMI